MSRGLFVFASQASSGVVLGRRGLKNRIVESCVTMPKHEETFLFQLFSTSDEAQPGANYEVVRAGICRGEVPGEE